MMAGEIPHDKGTIKIGNGVEVGYYAQHHADTLDMDATIYEIISRAAPDASPAKVRSMCGAFMFSGDDVDKMARVLSGGERARVALAKLCIAPGTLMLMDEPTNHLDLASSEALTESLKSYEGTLVFVSHNRSLIRNLATRIWNVEDGKVETYAGTLDEYMYSMSERRRAAGQDDVAALNTKGAAPTKHNTGKPAAPAPVPAKTRDDDKARKRREADERTKRNAKLGPLEKQVAQLEERIGTLEAEQKVRSAELADPAVYDDAPRRNKLLADYQSSQDKLDELNQRWEKTMAELESARAQLA
jgi:ATP-binding cassette subfamily F protein 3